MTKSEQKKIVADLLRSLTDTLAAKIDRVPENWDGHELRAWLLETARAGFDFGLCGTETPGRLRGPAEAKAVRARRKAFRNDLVKYDL